MAIFAETTSTYAPLSQPIDNEADLHHQLRSDPEGALTRLFELHHAYLCRVAVRIVRSEETAEDIVQEVFYDLWRKRAQLHIKGVVRNYLHRSVRNRSLNYLRDQRLLTVSDDELQYVGNAAAIQEELAAADLQVKIDRAIDSLPERCRLVFVLSRFEELSQREIAEQLNISTKTVENQMTKALRVLREKILPHATLWWIFVSWLTYSG